ncbi:MAG: acyl-CoA dehydratase activase [Candidatus Brocadiia bacterium]
MSLYAGLDVGSVSADIVLLDAAGEKLESRYIRTFGHPLQVVVQQLEEIAEEYGERPQLAVTGAGAEVVSELLEVPHINEIVAQSRAAARLYPDVRTVMDIGGEDSKLIRLESGEGGEPRVVDFALNSICAAGTGSFLDQQASRLNLDIEEFSQIALKSDNPPRVAGRCSVFAKSDMIHLQQQGTPDYDIVAGLCFAMARNFRSNLGKGEDFERPVAFQGGVAKNEGMRQAFREVLAIEDEQEFRLADDPGCTGALGAILEARDRRESRGYEDLEPLREHMKETAEDADRLKPLQDDGYETDISCQPLPQGEDPVDVYVGVDIGSISTNAVVVDSEDRVLARRYLMTEGRPLEAVKKALYDVGEQLGDRVVVRGCCTTGSGRYLSGEFVGADVVKNEITTHARGAVTMDPDVDTIFEIGGQDAKYISLEGGAVVDFAMNKVCAAGTGSFLEEQAERLDLSIEEEFGQTALSSDAPVKLGERCTVFMESDLNYHRQRGQSTEDLVGGLSYSIVHNYLNRVVEDRKVGENIFFQGGVAFNRGVKAAFEEVTGKKISVPPHQDVMGAYGAAIIARQQSDGESTFRGFDLREVDYELNTFECKACSNRCEIHKVSIEGQKPLHYGSRCGRFEDQEKYKKGEGLPELFEERREFLMNTYGKDEPENPLDVRIGMPRALTFFDQYPFWKAFFTELGCEVVTSDPTNRRIISEGAEHLTTETCFPIKVAHGHVANLMEKDVDYIFLPSIINLEEEAEGFVHSYLCPLVQSLPHLIRTAFDEEVESGELPLLTPLMHFERGREEVEEKLRDLAQVFEVPAGRTKNAIRTAWEAWDEFRQKCRERGGEILEELDEDEMALVVMSRPYNGCDPGMNLAIPDKLRDLGVTALPLDFLPLDYERVAEDFPHMFWKYGQNIIAAGQHVAEHDNLHAVYITNFRCGPDSFISKFFDRVIKEPYLTLEIDEHSADVGAITRCEAFLDSLRSSRRRTTDKEARGEDLFFDIREENDIKVYIPYMDDHGRMMAGVLRANGVDAEPLPRSDAKSIELGRKFTTGKECFPCILTTGDIVKTTQRDDFDPGRAAFFMAQSNGPCRFGQYHKFHRMVLDDLGHEEVPMVVLDQTEEFSDHVEAFGPDFYKACWELSLIVDFMQKMVREIRPYEINEGQTDRVYAQGLDELEQIAEEKGDYHSKAREIRHRLEAVPVDRSEDRPLIGIVGEIYVRSNEFANNFLVRRLEKAGAQVMMPPLQEWLSYIAADRREVAWEKGEFLNYVKEWLTEFLARWSEGKVAKKFEDALDHIPRESRIGEVLELGSEYLHPAIKGEAVLSMGRAVEYAEHGFDGVVNVAPFGCMPGAIVNSLLERYRQDYEMPVLKLDYDGLQQASEGTALEAFVHQARSHKEDHRRREGVGVAEAE